MKGPLSIPPESNSSQAGTSVAEDFSSTPMALKRAGPPVLFPIFIEIVLTPRHARSTAQLCSESARQGLLRAAPRAPLVRNDLLLRLLAGPRHSPANASSCRGPILPASSRPRRPLGVTASSSYKPQAPYRRIPNGAYDWAPCPARSPIWFLMAGL